MKRKQIRKSKSEKKRKTINNVEPKKLYPQCIWSMIFSYLSSDHHIKFLPLVCKDFKNIVNSYKTSWPPILTLQGNYDQIEYGMVKYDSRHINNIVIKIIYNEKLKIQRKRLRSINTPITSLYINGGKCYNVVNKHDCHTFMRQFFKCDTLESLKLNDYSSNDTKMFDELINNLYNQGKLKELSFISCNSIRRQTFKNLGKLNLRKFVLRNCNNVNTDFVLDKLNSCQLEELEITVNQLSFTNVIDMRIQQTFFERIRDENKSLRKLTIQSVNNSPIISDLLSYLPHLEYLEIYNTCPKTNSDIGVSNLKTLVLYRFNNDFINLIKLLNSAPKLERFELIDTYSCDLPDLVIDTICKLHIKHLKLINYYVDEKNLTKIKKLNLESFQNLI